MAGGLESDKPIRLWTAPILKNVGAGSSKDLNEKLHRIIITKTLGGKGTTYSAVGSWESGLVTTWPRYVTQIMPTHTGT